MPPPRALPEWAAIGVGLGALAVAHGAQLAGTVPCALCYVERWPYRVAVLLGVLGLLAGSQPGLRVLLRVLVLASLGAAAGLGFLHAGVEFGWWKSPLPECAAPILRLGSVKDLLASMPARPSKPCDDPTYLVPGLKLSMAELNLLYAMAGIGLVGLLWRRSGRA